MAETTFQKQILRKLETMEKKINDIVEHLEDIKLSSDDKRALKAALKEERDGKLLSKEQVFG